MIFRRRLLSGIAAGLFVPRAVGATVEKSLVLLGGGGSQPSLDLNFMSGVMPPNVLFTRASIASYFDAAGTIQQVTSGTPRFDYDPVTHALRGLGRDEARTNLFLNSATLGTQGVVVTAQPYQVSFYGTGSITFSGAFSGTLNSAGAFPARASVNFTPTAGTVTCTVSGSVLNANFEAGGFATSWIPTAGTTLNRPAETIDINVGGWYDVAKGSLAYEWMMLGNTAAFSSVVGFIGSNQVTDSITAGSFTTGGPNWAQFVAEVGNVSTLSGGNDMIGISAASWPGNIHKHVATWAQNGLHSTGVDGVLGSRGAVSALPVIVGLRILGLINSQPGPSGWIRRVRYYPRVLSTAAQQLLIT